MLLEGSQVKTKVTSHLHGLGLGFELWSLVLSKMGKKSFVEDILERHRPRPVCTRARPRLVRTSKRSC